MYRGRAVDYFPEVYDAAVVARATSLIEAGERDFVVAYNQEYDDMLHKYGPETKESIEALVRQCRNFERLAEAAHKGWRGCARMITFSPDHGGHFDAATGKGTHGQDRAEDMELFHFFGIWPKEA
jgi:hypothetical protein